MVTTKGVKRLFCLLAGALPLFGQACLQAPVVQGTITLSCTMIDNSAYGVASDVNVAGYLFQVVATSSNPAVSAANVTLTIVATPPPGQGSPATSTRTMLVQAVGGKFTYTFSIPVMYYQLASGEPTNLAPTPTAITAIAVQELQPANSQTFGADSVRRAAQR